MKLSYWVYYAIGLVSAVLFGVLTKSNGERNYIFLGLAIGGTLRGIYEMNKKFKSKNPH
jgi:membrane protease YdiL (CAAX protease family)